MISQSIANFSSKIKRLLVDAYTNLVVEKELSSWYRHYVHLIHIWSLGGIAGPPSAVGIPLVDFGGTANVYLHIKLPFAPSEDFTCRIEIDGYQYSGGVIVKSRYFVGRRAGVLKSDVSGNHSESVYTDGNGNLVCLLFVSNVYVFSSKISMFCQTHANRLDSSVIEARASLSNRVNF